LLGKPKNRVDKDGNKVNKHGWLIDANGNVINKSTGDVVFDKK